MCCVISSSHTSFLLLMLIHALIVIFHLDMDSREFGLSIFDTLSWKLKLEAVAEARATRANREHDWPSFATRDVILSWLNDYTAGTMWIVSLCAVCSWHDRVASPSSIGLRNLMME
ncbi:hypothetical protein K503DRAFT_344504 [Rhizopogon vinicolor AM-OR11-026]|uniref:Uncharacterized protein n=1 Tax=Rhizopogon vinicolor AM-OR11-026 TaxID=1314800 RepID=A0A1B7MTB0_9AGAM|nr:hypothetical protein K503DRAFT_344504 [Rhizopogon vinicolor AM-OR11-026]